MLTEMLIKYMLSMCIMSYTRDWSTSIPVNHSKFKNQPSHVRDFRTDIEERLQDFIYGFTAGETDTGIKFAPFIVQGTAPSTATDKFMLHGSDVNSSCELWGADEAGNRIQFSEGGLIGGTAQSATFNNVTVAGTAAYAGSVALDGGETGTKRQLMWFMPNIPTTGTSKSARVYMPFAATITKAKAYSKTAPVGADLIFDINKNGSTIWATQGNRVKVAAAANYGTQTSFDTTSLADGDYLDVDIDQIGSTTAGADITIALEITKA